MVANDVERRDEREHQHGEASREERQPSPGGVVTPPAPAKPDEPLQKERRRDHRREQHPRLEQPLPKQARRHIPAGGDAERTGDDDPKPELTPPARVRDRDKQVVRAGHPVARYGPRTAPDGSVTKIDTRAESTTVRVLRSVIELRNARAARVPAATGNALTTSRYGPAPTTVLSSPLCADATGATDAANDPTASTTAQNRAPPPQAPAEAAPRPRRSTPTVQHFENCVLLSSSTGQRAAPRIERGQAQRADGQALERRAALGVPAGERRHARHRELDARPEAR